MKPCFLGAFGAEGKPLWSDGEGGTQPSRPGPLAIHDLDGDGRTEVICFFLDQAIEADVTSMANVVIQIRDGATGAVKMEAAPSRFRSCRSEGANYTHEDNGGSAPARFEPGPRQYNCPAHGLTIGPL